VSSSVDITARKMLGENAVYCGGKGVEHRPVCDTQCTIMLIEPRGTLNAGSR
jgi:hypothetical protein